MALHFSAGFSDSGHFSMCSRIMCLSDTVAAVSNDHSLFIDYHSAKWTSTLVNVLTSCLHCHLHIERVCVLLHLWPYCEWIYTLININLKKNCIVIHSLINFTYDVLVIESKLFTDASIISIDTSWEFNLVESSFTHSAWYRCGVHSASI
jgi:hypothetical protein